ncbi:hypothetical protein K501DRAFT_336371 [Backusella circina FSU 941]|nr:hypothetical protein K501DRAFT_336371 [Backusella circina FSU 941]
MSSKNKFRSDYICRVRYRNTLPPIPYTAKMLTIPSLMERHASYQTTSLVQQTPYSLTMDQSATIPFDKSVIDYLDAMETNADEVARPIEEVAEEDKILLTAPRDAQNAMYTRKPNVTWLRRSEYIATETRSSSRREGVENKFAMSAASVNKKSYNTVADQVAGIEKTFRPLEEEHLVHPQTKSRAKKITPILPDMKIWENIYTIGQFNSEPADEKRMGKRKRDQQQQEKKPRYSQLDATDRGILRPMVNPHDPQDTYLVWFLPDGTGSKKLIAQKENYDSLANQTLNYNAVCDYVYKDEANSGSKYLLISKHDDEFDGESALYCPIRSKMFVRKKRALSAQFKYLEDYEKPNVLSVSFTD